MSEVEPRHHTPRSGSEPMPWQRAAADVALEYDPDTEHIYWRAVREQKHREVQASVSGRGRTEVSEPMPWQRAAADVALEYDPDTGLNRFGTVIVSVPRQAGKTALIEDALRSR